MKAKISLFFLLLCSSSAFAQEYEEPDLFQYIGVQTGLSGDLPYFNAGLRFLAEYQKEINKRWSYSITFDGSYNIDGATQRDESGNLVVTSPIILTSSINRRIHFIRNYWFWEAGLGGGVLYANNMLRPTIGVSLTTHIRLNKSWYLQLPLFIIPAIDRFYISPAVSEGSDYYGVLGSLNVGLKYML